MDILTRNYQERYLRDWTISQAGRSQTFEYYSGIEEGNPSGNKNLKSIAYFESDGQLVVVEHYVWDENDNLIKIYSTEN